MSKGGQHKGAGRPRGSGRYGMPSRPVRVPVVLTPEDIRRVIWRDMDELPEGNERLLVKFCDGKVRLVDLLGGVLMCAEQPSKWCYIPTNSGKGV